MVGFQSTDAFSPPFFAALSCKEDAIKGNIFTKCQNSFRKSPEIESFKPACPKLVFDSEKFYPLSMKNLPI